MQKQVVCVERLFDIQAVEEEKLSSRAYSFMKQENVLSIKNISFGYEKDFNVLNDFTLELPDKSFTALLGESGGGKSTILKLIMGLYEPNIGSIVFGGKDL